MKSVASVSECLGYQTGDTLTHITAIRRSSSLESLRLWSTALKDVKRLLPRTRTSAQLIFVPAKPSLQSVATFLTKRCSTSLWR